jgi:hypothetical protein
VQQRENAMSLDDERRMVYNQLERYGERLDRLEEGREDMREVVKDAIADSMPAPLLTDEEAHWVKLAIQREAQSIRLRQAIIEKTLAGLVWSAIVGGGLVLLDYIKAHGWKP